MKKARWNKNKKAMAFNANAKPSILADAPLKPAAKAHVWNPQVPYVSKYALAKDAI